jgi:predicted nucleic acid-binding protein
VRALFDSSVVIAHLRGDGRATERLLAVSTGERLASALTRVEVEGGMRSGERADVAALFAAMTLLPVTDAAARRASALMRRYRRSHSGIDLVDYVIAATAELHNAHLMTLNVRHFPMLGDLRPAWEGG